MVLAINLNKKDAHIRMKGFNDISSQRQDNTCFTIMGSVCQVFVVGEKKQVSGGAHGPALREMPVWY